MFHKDTGLADFYMNGMLVKEGSVIVDGTKRIFAGTVLTMQENSNLSLCKNGTIKAQSIVGTAKPVKLFAAVYENSVLKSVKSSETLESGTLSAEILIDKEQEQIVKVMVWDGVKALNDGKNLDSAEKTE